MYHTLEHAPAHYIIQQSEPMCLPTGVTSGLQTLDYTPEQLNECHFAVLDLDRFQFYNFSASRKDCETFRRGVLVGDPERDLQIVKIMFVWG